jgi:2-keto-4-pentenoate hydratase/2-oxohepta-3-ene-1,7-dioic acid hydratase in catechol pathway
MTGTPSGVGPIEAGQTVDGGIGGIGELTFTVK